MIFKVSNHVLYKYQPSSGQSSSLLMKTSCLRLKLVELNFFASFTTDDQSIFNVSYIILLHLWISVYFLSLFLLLFWVYFLDFLGFFSFVTFVFGLFHNFWYGIAKLFGGGCVVGSKSSFCACPHTIYFSFKNFKLSSIGTLSI